MTPVLLFAGALLLLYGASALGGGHMAGTARARASKSSGVASLVGGGLLVGAGVWLLLG